MAEIKINFDLTFSRRFVTVAAAAAVMLCAVPELDSESVTLSTYYPAPSGVYTNMITTANTFLARDGGNASMVGIGLTNPTVKVDIAQNGALKVGQAYLSSGGDYVHLANNEWFNGGAWVTNGSAGALLQITGGAFNFYTHTAAGAHTNTAVLDPSGNFTAVGNVTSSNKVSGLYLIGSASGGCVEVDYNISGTTNCPGNNYATIQTGVISKYVLMPLYQNSFTSGFAPMFCCTCPAGGCPAL